FKVIIRLIDQSGSAPVVLFNNNFFKLSGYTAWELMEKHGMDPDEYWSGELDHIVGKKCLFKIFFSEYNVNNNNQNYRCDAFSEDVQSDEFSTPSTLIKKVNILDSTVNRVLDMQSPTNAGEASGSGASSGSKKSFIFMKEMHEDKENHARTDVTVTTPKVHTINNKRKANGNQVLLTSDITKVEKKPNALQKQNNPFEPVIDISKRVVGRPSIRRPLTEIT
ncbi:replication protein A 70 kDa DNA-binding subunit B, partial [Tanacetum coccineum]